MLRRTEETKFRRSEKISGLIRSEIDQIIRREVKDPRVKNLTVTEVAITPDLKTADIWVCRFLDDQVSEQDKKAVIDGLGSARQFIYETLKRRLVMKSIPSLKFMYDFRLGEATHIWNLVKKVQDNEKLS